MLICDMFENVVKLNIKIAIETNARGILKRRLFHKINRDIPSVCTTATNNQIIARLVVTDIYVYLTYIGLYQMESDSCLLCKYIGGDNTYINSVSGYVAENIDKVSIDEMCVSISQTLQSSAGVDMTPAQVFRHVTEHISDKRVVLNSILGDLRTLLKTTMRHSVVVNEETNQTSIDHKSCALYLDAVKQVVSLYRTI